MDEKRQDTNDIVAGSDKALAERSSVLVSRGLRDLSKWDVTTFVELGKALTSSLHLDQVMRIVAMKLDQIFHAETWYLLLTDESKQELFVELAVGKESNELRDRRVKLGDGIVGSVAQNGDIAIATDAQRDPRFRQSVDGWPGLETHSLVAIPLRCQNTCLGLIGLVNYVGLDGLPQSDLSLLQALCDFAAIAIHNSRYVSAIHELTITDEFTGLYRGRHLDFILDAEIYRSERYGYEFSLLFVDLDGLKGLRKTLSYEHFVQLLKELGEAFKHQLRLIDFAFRSGGEEFVVLLLTCPPFLVQS